MASAKEYPLYVAKGDWSDDDQKYGRSSAMFWGAQSKQYLTIAQGGQYYSIIGLVNLIVMILYGI